jgi:hypothetical protein
MEILQQKQKAGGSAKPTGAHKPRINPAAAKKTDQWSVTLRLRSGQASGQATKTTAENRSLQRAKVCAT